MSERAASEGARDGGSELIEVALPLPLFQTFTYALPPEHAGRAGPGVRVLVPLRTGREIGISLGPSDGAGVERPRAVLDVPDPEPVVSEAMLALCRWIAEYYVVPLGIVLRCILPAVLGGSHAPRPAQKTQRVAVLRRELPSLQERESLFGRAKRQRELYELLEAMGGRSPVSHVTDQLGFSAAVLRALVSRGLVEIAEEVVW